METIVLVEDDKELASLVQEYLNKNGFFVHVCHDGGLAVDQIVDSQPSMVILDVMLPGKSGMDICKELRAQYASPILMLTALDEDIDQMLGLELGADDYVIKPIKPRLLLSRVRALLRRSHYIKAEKVTWETLAPTNKAPLFIDIKKRMVYLHDQPVSLTTAEFDLLRLLAEHEGKTVSRDTIISQLRGFEYDGLDRSIDRRISRLRKKIQDDPSNPMAIKTVRGKGYLLSVDVEF